MDAVTHQVANEAKATREYLGLSQAEMAVVLGFSASQERTIRYWEAGERDGAPFNPTPLARSAMVWLHAMTRAYRIMPEGMAKNVLREALPEILR